jgi:uncharacterized protein (TIGR01777 family)
MKVIVAGGTGFIGKLLVARLLAEEHTLWVLTRHPQKHNFPPGVQGIRWDGRSPEGWGHFIEEADAIINLTGENLGASRWTPQRKALLRSSRIEPAAAIAEAIAQASHRPAVLLQSSAVGYYGSCQDQLIDENSPAGVDSLSQLVVDWENASRPVEALGVKRIIVRQGIVLDDKEGALPRMLLPFRFFVGGPVGSGRQWIAWISRRDIVEAMIFLLQPQIAGGVYNLMSPQPVTNAEFGKTIAHVLRRPYWMPVPAFVLRLVFGEMATVVLDGQRAIPGRLLAAGYQFRYPALEMALEEIFKH